MKKIRKHLLAVLPAAVCAACCLSLHSAAEGSVEDVYAAMRRIGMPETMIQNAKNRYETVPHDADGMEIEGQYYPYDVWAELVILQEDEIWEKVGQQFGVSGPEIRKAMQTTAPPASQSADPEPTKTEPVTYPEPEKPFINMTLEEKQAYVAALPEDQRAAFLASLSTSERNSIIKQMDTGSQADIANNFINLGEQLGMHISVDQLGENGISYSVRDGEGTLIDSTSVGAAVDDTGWDMTVPVIASGSAVLLAVGGLVWLGRRGRKQEAFHG